MSQSIPVTQKTLSLIAVTAIGLISIVGCSPQTPVATTEPVEQTEVENNSSTESATLKNLQAAYNGESNAHIRYLAFAEKADAEGYKQVATLFRAAAMAEQIHRDNHAAVIQQMGGTPQTNLETPEVKFTAENLQAEIEGESYERDVMYPQFIEEATQPGNREAVPTFKWAMAAEREYANYYTQAKENLAEWKEARQAFYVCPECGFTIDTIGFANCPECGTPKEDF